MLLGQLGFQQVAPTVIQEDNQAAIFASANPMYHGRLKHVVVSYHYIRELIHRKEVVLEYCSSKFMLADMLTKPIPRKKFIQMRNSLGMVSASKR